MQGRMVPVMVMLMIGFFTTGCAIPRTSPRHMKGGAVWINPAPRDGEYTVWTYNFWRGKPERQVYAAQLSTGEPYGFRKSEEKDQVIAVSGAQESPLPDDDYMWYRTLSAVEAEKRQRDGAIKGLVFVGFVVLESLEALGRVAAGFGGGH